MLTAIILAALATLWVIERISQRNTRLRVERHLDANWKAGLHTRRSTDEYAGKP